MTWDLPTAILVATTLVGFGTPLVLIYKSRAEKRKIEHESDKLDADAIAVISNSAIALLGPMEKQVKNLEDRLATVTRRAQELENKYETASAELAETAKRLTETLQRCDELETLTERLLSELRRYRDGDLRR